MAELLLGEMMREWRFGFGEVGTEEEEEWRSLNHHRRRRRVDEEEEEYDDNDDENEEAVEGLEEKSTGKRKRGNERVKPDVVTFTAV